jgi:deazaflavin-dependent oxidoreductase (nitroreductase family)
MQTDRVMKLANAFHKAVLTVTFGKVGWKAAGMLVIELTTTGRRSGQPRTCLLTSPLQLGDTVVIVASRGGDSRHPDWYHNLLAHPEVQVSVGGTPKERRIARVATDDERVELWPRAVRVYPSYDKYQAKTTRRIPMVLLEPVA